MEKIIVNNIEVEVIRKNVKNINLSIYPDGTVRMSVPKKINEDILRRFIESKTNWIYEKKLILLNKGRLPMQEYISGENHYFLGNKYVLNVVNGKINNVEIDKNNLNLYVNEGSTREQRLEVLNKFYREKLKELIPLYIEKWENIMGVKVNSWAVKNMKTRWGSCNIIEKRIWINLQLAKRPEICLEYIVIHEMVHLLEKGHNKRFYSFMDKYMPEWRIYKEELKVQL